MVLEGLRDIEWDKLKHANGNAEDMPDLLKALLSKDDNVVEEVCSELFNNLLHQGSVYEATAYAVPFLLEILQHQTLMSEAWYKTLELVASIANDGIYQKKIYDELKQGLFLFLRWLKAPDEEIVLAIAQILVLFPDDAPTIAPALRDAITTSINPIQQGHLLILLGKLLEGVAESYAATLKPHAAFVEPYLSANQPEIIRLGAGHVHFAVYHANSDKIAIEILCDAFLAPDNYETDFLFFDYYVNDEVAACLDQFPTARVLPPLLKKLPQINDVDRVHDIVLYLLARVFEKTDDGYTISLTRSLFAKTSYEVTWLPGDKVHKPQRPLSLTPDQRTGVEAIANFDVFWKIKTNLLEVFGLPAKRDDLRAYLARLKSE